MGILYSFDKVEPEASIFVVQLGHWITAFFSMTFATNVICTGASSAYPRRTHTETLSANARMAALVAYRIWTINRAHVFRGFRHRNLRPVLVLIVESGALYSATLLALLVLYNVGSWFQYVVLDAVSAIVVSALPPEPTSRMGTLIIVLHRESCSRSSCCASRRACRAQRARLR